ncbi:glycosyltransferase family 4 protein [Neorhizobium alkalisoli]|uniref:Glycosyl transferase family 1 n=1 Tax=Neorhizobium alkalisoli TaxID=528178 RepID=A0A561R3F5_9HYPH|nr:glycosyltransferase family 4 protein [Neorhizobium alkalisoli]TWF57150.1 hypothetical protein FHW37_102791 [Neorhizobium alkalisoli]
MNTWKPDFVGGNPIRTNSSGELNDILLRAMVPELSGRTAAETRVLVFSSNVDATVEISFLAPARSAPEGICLAVIDDARMRSLGSRGLEALFGAMAPTHVVFCRYWGGNFSAIVDLAKSVSAATLTFLDDNLLSVPPETGTNVYAFFQDKRRRQVLEQTIRDVDLFVPSTPALSEDLSVYRTGEVADWGIYRSADPAEFRQGDLPEPRPVIGYMASESHAADLESYVPALVKLLATRPELRMEFFGTIRPPEALGVFGNRVVTRGKANSYADFMRRLKRLRWMVGLAPLADTPFNRTKACTKWVEYTLADIPTIANSQAVYGRAADRGAIAMASSETFFESLTAIIDDRDLRNSLLTASRELISSDYRLDSHLSQLKQTLEQATRILGERLSDRGTTVGMEAAAK